MVFELVWCCFSWCGVVSVGVVLFQLVWCCFSWCGVVSVGVVLFQLVWCWGKIEQKRLSTCNVGWSMEKTSRPPGEWF